MKKFFLIIFLCSSGTALFAQRHRVDSANVKHPFGIYLALGPSLSGIDVYKNYLQNPHRAGFFARICYEFSNSMRVTGEFTRIPRFAYQPSWENLSAFNIDLNMQFMARIKDEKAIFYLLLGAGSHNWRGRFVQQSAYYDAVAGYQPGSVIRGGWAGMNIGVGLERAFKHFELFGDYRYRFTKIEGAFAVSDVALNIGIKKKIPFRKIFRGLSDRYTWF